MKIKEEDGFFIMEFSSLPQPVLLDGSLGPTSLHLDSAATLSCIACGREFTETEPGSATKEGLQHVLDHDPPSELRLVDFLPR